MPTEELTITQDFINRQTARITESFSWYGTMTTWNAAAIADRLRQLLAGKRYTFVAINGGCPYSPDVRTRQILRGGRGLRLDGDAQNICLHLSEGCANIVGCDSYGVWSFSSTTTDMHSFNEYRQPYCTFNDREFRVTHRAPCGDILVWVFALE
jgi:hypothetical protein